MAEPNEKTTPDTTPLPNVRVPKPSTGADFATILGLILSIAVIAIAIISSESNANFFNLPSVLIVIIGTITATTISYTGHELSQSLSVISSSLFRPIRNFTAIARALLDLSSIARKRGILQISNYEKQTKNEPFLNKAMRLVVDGCGEEDVYRILQQEIDMEEERLMRAASVLRRASEIAPAMGLIGTLVGLVQMLADLEDPQSIGKNMAIALLTTFYGAIMGTVVLAPLAAKLERNAAEEITFRTMSLKTAISMLRQENPRNLEMIINSLLPASQRVRYFK